MFLSMSVRCRFSGGPIFINRSTTFSYLISPAFLSSWGPSLLAQVTFPIGDNIRPRCGLIIGPAAVAIGLDADMDYGKDKNSVAKIVTTSFKIKIRTESDQCSPRNSDLALSLLSPGPHPDHRGHYALVNITKLSDAFVMQDFFPANFVSIPSRITSLPYENQSLLFAYCLQAIPGQHLFRYNRASSRGRA